MAPKKKRSSPQERDALVAGFVSLIEHYGLSTDNPQDGWNLAFALYMDFLQEKGRTRKAAGRKTTVEKVARDGIGMAGIHVARRDGDTRGEKPILRDIARANGWPAGRAAVETLWRRYQELKKPTSRERQALVKAIRAEIAAGE